MTFVKLEDAVKAVTPREDEAWSRDATQAFDHAVKALRSLPTDDGWEDIATAPVDESILCAVQVAHNKTGASWWEMHVISIDSETGEISSDNDAGWAAGDYTHWRPLPAPPSE